MQEMIPITKGQYRLLEKLEALYLDAQAKRADKVREFIGEFGGNYHLLDGLAKQIIELDFGSMQLLLHELFSQCNIHEIRQLINDERVTVQ